ncbi:hypothetical protein SeLEV6574_g08028, partial [Synchytrium endobioticum]
MFANALWIRSVRALLSGKHRTYPDGRVCQGLLIPVSTFHPILTTHRTIVCELMRRKSTHRAGTATKTIQHGIMPAMDIGDGADNRDPPLPGSHLPAVSPDPDLLDCRT